MYIFVFFSLLLYFSIVRFTHSFILYLLSFHLFFLSTFPFCLSLFSSVYTFLSVFLPSFFRCHSIFHCLLFYLSSLIFFPPFSTKRLCPWYVFLSFQILLPRNGQIGHGGRCAQHRAVGDINNVFASATTRLLLTVGLPVKVRAINHRIVTPILVQVRTLYL